MRYTESKTLEIIVRVYWPTYDARMQEKIELYVTFKKWNREHHEQGEDYFYCEV